MSTSILPWQLTPVLPLQDPSSAHAASSSSRQSSPPVTKLPITPRSSTDTTSQHWNISHHVFPAAYPRSRVGSYVRSSSQSSSASTSSTNGGRLSKEELEQKVQDMRKCQYEAQLQGEQDEGQLWIAANCYRPKRVKNPAVNNSRSRPVTLVLVHATGLHKETWETAFTHMLSSLESTNVSIAEVWSLDIVNQGDSAVLNADHLGYTFDWVDVARDIAQFYLRYLPSYSAGRNYPVRLPEQEIPSENLLRLQGSQYGTNPAYHLWRGRYIVGAGHSIGGASSVSACSFLPEGLVKGLILVDPTCQPLEVGSVEGIMALVKGAIVRRDTWNSREEALAGFAKNKGFFGRWDKEVLKAYVDHALYQVEGGKFMLKTARLNEAVTFLDPNLRGTRNCWSHLSRLSPSLKVHVILADPADSVIQSRNISPERLFNELKQTRPTYTQLYGVHHMIVQEAPKTAGDIFASTLQSWMPDRTGPRL